MVSLDIGKVNNIVFKLSIVLRGDSNLYKTGMHLFASSLFLDLNQT